MINPFVICSVDELIVIRQHADRQVWEVQCMALGVPADETRAFDALALVYARTTPYPNSDILAYLRKLAMEALARGEPMPADMEALLEAEHERRLARWFS